MLQALCVIGSVFISDTDLVLFGNMLGQVVISVGILGGIVATLALIAIYISKEDHHITELAFLFIYGIMNIIASILLLVERTQHEARNINYLILASTSGSVGLLMIVDFIREFKVEFKYT